MIFKLAAKATLVGVAAALAVAAPAAAADTPTITGPADRTGFGLITLSGTATPGAAVHLYESAIVFDDLLPAEDWENGGGVVTATADSTGHYQMHRYLDSGFYFQAESDGVLSARLTVHIRALPTLTLSSPATGQVRAHVTVSPAEPTLPVQVQEAVGSVWTTVSTGRIDDLGGFTATMAGLAGGTHRYRAYIGADPANGVLAGYSSAQTVSLADSTAAGAVQFTKIQYDSPGSDTGSNTSLNGEWVRLTNKSAKTINLLGWTVRDASAHVYTFSTYYNLRAGQSVTVYTGKGTAATARRYWGRTGYVWNNTGDTATLRTGSGKTVDSCKWGKGSGSTAC
jgi:hypothetical protein